MKYFAFSLIAVALAGCMETSAPVTVSDAKMAELTARHKNTIYGQSGMSPAAYVGAVQNPGFIDLFYEPKYTTPAEVAAAPAKLCAYKNGKVTSAAVKPHPAKNYYPTARVLEVRCTT